MGVADLCDACSDWLTIGLQFGQMSPTDVADVFWCRRHLWASVNRRLTYDEVRNAYATSIRRPFDCLSKVIKVTETET